MMKYYSIFHEGLDDPIDPAAVDSIRSNATLVQLAPLVQEMSSPAERSAYLSGRACVVDVSERANVVADWFDENGLFHLDHITRFDELVATTVQLEVPPQDIVAAARKCAIDFSNFDGVIFRTGLSQWWVRDVSEVWRYRYYYSPYLLDDAIDLLVSSSIRWVTIESPYLDDVCQFIKSTDFPVELASSNSIEAKKGLRILLEYINRESGQQRATKRLLAADVSVFTNVLLPVNTSVGSVQYDPGISDDTGSIMRARPSIVL